jgi:hypothetical protein
MPFASKAQARFLFANHPEIAARWEKEYHQSISRLPERVKKHPVKKKKKSKKKGY